MKSDFQFQNKRLLILGNRTMMNGIDIMPVITDIIDVVQTAKHMGIYTIVTYDSQEYALKNIADKIYAASITDIESLVEIAKLERIDGVIAGINELALQQAITLCEMLHLPYYATHMQWNTLQNKENYKTLCSNFDIDTPETFKISMRLSESDLSKIVYPVVVKPVDGSGGNGISVCQNAEELKIGCEKALAVSKRKEVVVESYIEGNEVTVYYTVQDGFISLSAMSEKCLLKQKGYASLPYLLFFPSRYLEIYTVNYNNKIINMLKYMKVKNAFLFIQGFISDDKFITHEMGYRFAGTEVHKIISKINGVNALEMSIRYSLSGKMSGWNLKTDDNPNFRRSICIWRPFLRRGKITRILGLNKIMHYPEVINFESFFAEGDIIDDLKMGTLGQAIVMVTFIIESRSQMISLLTRAKNDLLVTDENGDSMVIDVDISNYCV